jgi:hypothetical protein
VLSYAARAGAWPELADRNRISCHDDRTVTTSDHASLARCSGMLPEGRPLRSRVCRRP